MKVGWNPGEARTFAMDTGMTPGILNTLPLSITTYRQRKQGSEKYFIKPSTDKDQVAISPLVPRAPKP